MTRTTRPISWIAAALKEFETFPEGVRSMCLAALTIAAEGGKADVAKPMHGMGWGVFVGWRRPAAAEGPPILMVGGSAL